MKKIIKNAAILTVITLVAGCLLGFVYDITKEPIAAANEAKKNAAYQVVMADATEFEEIEFDAEEAAAVVSSYEKCSIDVVAVAKANGEAVGYVITTTSGKGYGGDIQISVGIANDGTVTGMEILSIAETAGLGMNADKPEFKAQYADKAVDEFVVTKTGAADEDEIDAISGATITSNAVTNAVNSAVAYFNNVLGGSANE